MLEVLLGDGPLDHALDLLVAYLEGVSPVKGIMVSRVSGLMAASLKIKHVIQKAYSLDSARHETRRITN